MQKTSVQASTSPKGSVGWQDWVTRTLQELGRATYVPTLGVDVVSPFGSVEVRKAFSLAGAVTPTQVAANQNDYAPTGLSAANVLRLSTDASRTLTGLQAPAIPGQTILLMNVGSFPLVLSDEDALSAVANRFALDGNVTIAAGTSVWLFYDATLARWVTAAQGGISGSYQPLDGDLTAIAALAANGILARTAANTWAVRTITAGASIGVTDGDGVAGNPTIAVTDNELVILAGLTAAADKAPYFTGASSGALMDFTSVARTLVGQSTQALMRTTGLGMSANGSSLVSAASYAAMRALLDLEAGTDFYSIAAADAAFQPKDAELTALAGLTSAADSVPYFTGSGTAALATLSSVARTLIAQSTQALMRSTGLGLGTAAVEASGTSGHALGFLDGANTWSGIQTFTANPVIASAVAPILQFNETGVGDWFLVADAGTFSIRETSLGGTIPISIAVGGVVNFALAPTFSVPSTTRTNLGLSANGSSLVTAANYAAMRALLDLEAGTDFLSPAAIAAAYQGLDATLTSLAAVAGVQGDLLYASGADAWARLAKDTNATRYLANTGASNNPAWAQIDLTNGVTGDLPFANLAQGAALSVLGVTGNATADVAAIAAGTDHQVLRRSGTSVAFGALNLAQGAATTGTLIHERGGLEADVSAYDGILRITGGATSALTYIPWTAFTLTVIYATPGTGSISVGTGTGYYARIGDTVFVNGTLSFTPTKGTASGLVIIGGFPVTSHATPASYTGAVSNMNANWVWPAGTTKAEFAVQAGNSRGWLVFTGSGVGATSCTVANLTNGVAHTLNFSVTYMAA